MNNKTYKVRMTMKEVNQEEMTQLKRKIDCATVKGNGET